MKLKLFELQTVYKDLLVDLSFSEWCPINIKDIATDPN